jgi:hypothetical protein
VRATGEGEDEVVQRIVWTGTTAPTQSTILGFSGEALEAGDFPYPPDLLGRLDRRLERRATPTSRQPACTSPTRSAAAAGERRRSASSRSCWPALHS